MGIPLRYIPTGDGPVRHTQSGGVMKKLGLVLFVALLVSACAVQQRYYIKSNLNNISIEKT
jgi:hypothetical protein